jgi:hypothetical protein
VAKTVGLVLAAGFCFVSVASQAASVGCPYNFVGTRGKANIEALATGVVQLFDTHVNDARGTAYFINDRLLITAVHVTQDESGAPRHLSGQNSAINQGRRFNVGLVDTDYDVALLRVTDSDFQGPITAIDISFWVPAMAEGLWVIGYPGGQVGVNATYGPLSRVLQEGDPLSLKSDVAENDKAGHLLYEVKHFISDGYSGGPLLTEEGRAIGTVHEIRNDNMAYYEPLSQDKRLLLQLKDLDLPSGLKNVDNMVLNGAPEQNIAAAFLVGQISNVSLTSWYYHLLRSPEFDSHRSPTVASLIRCPIMKLFRDRDLESLADGLLEVASHPDTYGGSPPPLGALGAEKTRGRGHGH